MSVLDSIERSGSREGSEIPPETAAFPDPLISTNLYAFRRLDRVIARVVVPFQLAAEAKDLNQSFYLWIFRYARGGEHLKVRVHGSDSLRDRLNVLLERAWEHYSSGLDPEEKIFPLPQRRTPPPPIDLEDQERLNDYPNGTLLHTRCRRSPIIFGASPLLRDDRYIALFTCCLGRACSLVLRSFELDETDQLPYKKRQALLLRILGAGLPVVFPRREQLQEYAVYHRDWLVRARVLASRGRMAKAWQVLDQYDSEMARIAPSSLKEVSNLLRIPEPEDLREKEWARSLVALRSYLQEVPALNPDPFVQGSLYPSLFKVFHCVANQLGLTPLNEGLGWNLLLNAIQGNGTRDGFRLVPF